MSSKAAYEGRVSRVSLPLIDRHEIRIRPFEDRDWTAVWKILQPVFRAGETYAVPRDISEDVAKKKWTEPPASAFVAENEATADVLGTYYLRANFEGAGAHVANCGYVVSPAARGRGVATMMCAHSQRQAAAGGFLAMQFNLVAASNATAVRLWAKLGFEIVGTLPGAFLHPGEGYVDAYVMFKSLEGAEGRAER